MRSGEKESYYWRAGDQGKAKQLMLSHIHFSTQVNAYPWMAALTTNAESFYCGGTLVAAEWVVTAAHCVFQDGALTVTTPVKDMKIVLGEHNKTNTNSKIPRKVVAVKQIITHPDFKSKTVETDLAMIKLAEPVDLEVYIPACLPSPGQDPTGEKALVYGGLWLG